MFPYANYNPAAFTQGVIYAVIAGLVANNLGQPEGRAILGLGLSAVLSAILSAVGRAKAEGLATAEALAKAGAKGKAWG